MQLLTFKSKNIIKSQEIGVILSSLYPLCSMLTVGAIAKKSFVNVPRSEAIENVLVVLYKCGRIRGFDFFSGKNITVYLNYYRNEPLIRNLRVFKSQGFSRHFSVVDLYNYAVKSKVVHPTNILILSTPVGIITHWEAMVNKVGGIGLLELQ